jgi:hypothetical protein
MENDFIIGVITIIGGVILMLQKLRKINWGMPLDGKDRRKGNAILPTVCPAHSKIETVIRSLSNDRIRQEETIKSVKEELEKRNEKFDALDSKVNGLGEGIATLLERTKKL